MAALNPFLLESQSGKPLPCVEDYPDGLTEQPTLVLLKKDTTRKILICDTLAWYQATLEPMSG